MTALAGLSLGGGLVAGPSLEMAGAGATTARRATRVVVPGGVQAKLIPHASAFGTTPATTPETVSFVLAARDARQLEQQASRTTTSFLSTAQFAADYGQTSRAITAVTNYLSAYGISTTVFADHLDVHAHGTAGEFDAALTVHQREYFIPATHGSPGTMGSPAQTVHSPTSAPELPREIARIVEAVVGLDDYGPYVSEAVHVPRRTAERQSRTANPTTCASATPLVTDADACHTPAYFASNYDLDPLYAKGAEGQGETIGIVTFAPLDTTAPEHFWQTVLHMTPSARTVSTITVDGGPTSTATGSGETDLDTEQSGAIAPDASIDVYQAPNSTSGFVDAFFGAASTDVATDVSTSWGQSETFLQVATATDALTARYVGAVDEAYMEMAVQGESMFASAGDTGAYDAYGTVGTTNLAVDNPADSPYVTAAGGTTAPFSATISSKAGTAAAPVSVTAQRAWGWDYLWSTVAALTGITELKAAEQNPGGGGGGYSALEPMPPYQSGIAGIQRFSDVEYLTPTAYKAVPTTSMVLPTSWSLNPSPSVEQGVASGGRAVPDVAADADPFSGYLLYGPTITTGTSMVLQGGWGGTSFVAPQLNAATAVIDSALGHRVGFWNPQIYAFAQSRTSPFTPLDASGTGNDDLYYTGTQGALYDPATGLGTPDLAVLEAEFAAETVTAPGGGGR